MASHFRNNATEFLLLTGGCGDNSHVFDILKRRANDPKVLQERLAVGDAFSSCEIVTSHRDHRPRWLCPGWLLDKVKPTSHSSGIVWMHVVWW